MELNQKAALLFASGARGGTPQRFHLVCETLISLIYQLLTSDPLGTILYISRHIKSSDFEHDLLDYHYL